MAHNPTAPGWVVGHAFGEAMLVHDPRDALLFKAREWIVDLSRPLPYVPTEQWLDLIDEIDRALVKAENRSAPLKH
jgi:hypothetical protein